MPVRIYLASCHPRQKKTSVWTTRGDQNCLFQYRQRGNAVRPGNFHPAASHGMGCQPQIYGEHFLRATKENSWLRRRMGRSAVPIPVGGTVGIKNALYRPQRCLVNAFLAPITRETRDEGHSVATPPKSFAMAGAAQYTRNHRNRTEKSEPSVRARQPPS